MLAQLLLPVDHHPLTMIVPVDVPSVCVPCMANFTSFPAVATTANTTFKSCLPLPVLDAVGDQSDGQVGTVQTSS
jgi:hypothetical protein